jgi:hypothetical protein
MAMTGASERPCAWSSSGAADDDERGIPAHRPDQSASKDRLHKAFLAFTRYDLAPLREGGKASDGAAVSPDLRGNDAGESRGDSGRKAQRQQDAAEGLAL